MSKEVRISMTELDAIQRHLRLCISPLEILGNTRPDPRNGDKSLDALALIFCTALLLESAVR